ncbi:hypothetical protein NIES4103_14040 [Nostoc sp. NIES-4103]|nr:hypothetical protein NIES4103_14040 [Nostoc sp. NIES-4103]
MSDSTRSLGLKQQPQLVHLIDAIAARLNPILFPPHSLSALRSLTAKLPPASPLLFELRMLEEEDSTLDLSLPLPEDFCLYKSDWVYSSCWEKIVALRTASLAGGEFAGAIATNVFWCEFDFDQMFNPIPLPGVFLNISPELSKSKNNSFLSQLICRAVSILRGEIVPDSIQQNLETTLQTLPADVYFTQFGVMLSRPASSIRVNFSGWQAENIASWLENVGCKAVAAEVTKVTQQIPNLLDRMMVTLDIAESINPRVGIECYPTSMQSLSSCQQSGDWLGEFTTWLTTHSLASSCKAKALRNWNGYKESSIESPDSDQGYFWGYYACATDISHLKLVFDPIAGLQAKAYILADFIHPDDDESQKAPAFFLDVGL